MAMEESCILYAHTWGDLFFFCQSHVLLYFPSKDFMFLTPLSHTRISHDILHTHTLSLFLLCITRDCRLEETQDFCWRGNSRGVDINRNFDWNFGGPGVCTKVQYLHVHTHNCSTHIFFRCVCVYIYICLDLLHRTKNF